MKLNKIFIIGGPGSGKTYLAKKLSEKLKIKHYDLDNIFWKRKYDIKRDEKEKIRLINKILKTKKGIIEGVYTSEWIRKLYKKTDLVILLDIKLPRLIFRILKRLFKDKENKRNLKGTLGLIKFAKRYRSKKFDKGHQKHLELINKHKPNIIILKNKRQIKGFIKSI